MKKMFCLFAVAATMSFCSGAGKIEFKVNVNSDSIEIVNTGSAAKDFTACIDANNGTTTFYIPLTPMKTNEKIVLNKSEIKKGDGTKFPANEKIKRINFIKPGKGTLFTWNYTPVLSDPTGLTFISSKRKVVFGTDGKFESYTKYMSKWAKDESNAFLHEGTFTLDESKNITIKCGKYTWDGYFEDDELTLKIHGGTPEGAGALFSGAEYLTVSK